MNKQGGNSWWRESEERIWSQRPGEELCELERLKGEEQSNLGGCSGLSGLDWDNETPAVFVVMGWGGVGKAWVSRGTLTGGPLSHKCLY